MQIVIDIPDWVYKHIVQGNEEAPDENISIDAIRNGTVLPKNHGRLTDADALEGEPYLMSEGNGMECIELLQDILRQKMHLR